MRRGVLVAGTATLLAGVWIAPMAVGAESTSPSIVLVVRDVSLVQLLEIGHVREVATSGGAALLAHAERLDALLTSPESLAGAGPPVTVGDLGSGERGLAALERRLRDAAPDRQAPPTAIWIVSPGSGLPGDELGALVASTPAWAPGSSVRSLTSTSTRRDGVVVVEDIAATICDLASATCTTGGSAIEPVDVAPPLDLYVRYLANRRMSVPIQTAAGLFVTFAGLLGVALLVLRERVPPWLSAVGAWMAIAVVPLGVTLLFAGHLESLTYASVLTVVIGGTALGCVAAALVARRWGSMTALAVLGAGTIALFVLEAALGWTAALTTFLGGTELDGGRFYGLPNVDIGLLLGAGVFVAHRLRGTWPGVVVLAALAAFAGLPFAGANLGAAVTLGAGAGLWWGFRQGRPGWAIACAALAGGGLGGALTLVANAVLPGAATHITNFVEGGGDGVVGTALHRLGTGLELIRRNPFAIVPVIGVPATLMAVVRPAAPIRASFERHPGWREALLAILWGGVVAYLANDTGAAALGLTFGSALGALLFVSLRDRAWMMGAT